MTTEQTHQQQHYDPESYWSGRAAECTGLGAVCVYDATEIENRCAERMQTQMLKAALRDYDLNGKDVLEYGCGTGRWVPFFRQRGAAWRGVDISATMLERARALHPGVPFDLTVDNRIPADDHSVDLVYSITVVHHNPYPDQERIVAEMVRVLRPAGRLILIEGIDPRRRFNMFPRPVNGWTALLADQSMRCVFRRTFRSRILRDMLKVVGRRVTRRTGRDDGTSNRIGLSRRMVAPLDLAFDRYLVRLLPRRFHDGAVMAFERKA